VNQPLSLYARLGLVHHMLYPQCTNDPDFHADTLAEFVQRDDIETFDCCIPYGPQRRAKLYPLIRACGKKDLAFALHLFPIRKLFLSTPHPIEQAQVRLLINDMIEQAAAMGASCFIFGAGGPCPAEASPEHYAAFADFCLWLCRQLQPHGITAMLEPFDTAIDKKFLYGPTEQCVELMHSLAKQVDNFAIELDMAHVPLMGETFEHAIRTTAPHLRRVHLGNCVLKDKTHPRYGDTHPPVGFPGGEIDTPELTRILRGLFEVGFLNTKNRGSMLLEITPWPGKSVQESINDNLERLHQAWQAV